VESGAIERELRIDAPPEIVYEVVSTPEHIREWWSAGAARTDRPGTLRLTFGDGAGGVGAKAETIVVVDENPPHRFSFRWIHDAGEHGSVPTSLLVTFDLAPEGAGTLLRFSETGFREKGWEAAVLEETYRDHAAGWDVFLPRLVSRAERVRARA
jgi:uncharacterized protein YndB with AHSA1/START domain